jgi:hypothetical protein
MYGLKVRKQYAKLYKEALEKLASAFGVQINTGPTSTRLPRSK